MRRAFYTVLLAGVFLLLLSALVVTPEPAPEQRAVPDAADFHAVFRPLVSAMLPQAAEAPSGDSDMRLVPLCTPALILCCMLFTGTRDANGRVLSACRYVNSVHQLFRPEVAGG